MKKFLFASLIAPSLLLAGEPRDAVVLGDGVGGLTSALYLSRAGLHPLVISGQNPGGALAQSPLVQNWPGELSIPGGELIEKIREQARQNGTEFLNYEVVGVDFSSDPLRIVTRDPLDRKSEKIIEAKTIIIATGATPKKLGVRGEEAYWLKGVHTCAVCDGSLYKDREVAVVGGGDAAITEALHLTKLVKKVTLLVRSGSLKSIEAERKEQLLATPNVEVLYNTTVQEIRGDKSAMNKLVIKNKESGEHKVLDADALFLAIGSTPNTQYLKGQLELDDEGYIVLHDQQQTSKRKVFAIGDAVDPEFRQAVTAAGDGAKAALQAEKLLATAARHSEGSKQAHEESPVINIKSLEHFDKEVLSADGPVIVDFYADWCGPCKMLEPHMQIWSKRFHQKIKFAKVNIDQFAKLAQKYGVRAVPTVLYFDKDGNVVETRIGMQEISGLIDNLDTPTAKTP